MVRPIAALMAVMPGAAKSSLSGSAMGLNNAFIRLGRIAMDTNLSLLYIYLSSNSAIFLACSTYARLWWRK